MCITSMHIPSAHLAIKFAYLMFHFGTVSGAVYCFPLKERSYSCWFSSAPLAKQCVRFGFFAD